MSEAPDPVETEEIPEEFREQPGDREPEAVLEPDPEPEPEEDEPDSEPEPEPEPEASGEPETPPQKKDWRDRQIAKLREKEKAREAELEELRKRAETAEALIAASPEERGTAADEKTREAIRQEEAAKVREEARYKSINDGLTAMDAAGKKAFGEAWDAQVVQAAELFGKDLAARPDLLEALTELPNSAAVYNELTADLDRMEALLRLPAYKMGAELARMSDRLAKPAPRQVSRAPAPIKPIQTDGVERDLESLINDPNASMDEINRRMSAEERKRAKAH